MKIRILECLMIIPAFIIAGCAGTNQSTATAADALTPKPHMSMLQLMRAFPFPHANVLFDTQSTDPAKDTKSSMSYSVYRWGETDAYAGWPGVENSALALSEMAPLLLVPGRLCANGKPAPVEREDWKKYTQELVAAGEAAYKAAQTKNMDRMLEVSETITNACAACHEVYRDIDQQGKDRCSLPE